MAKVFIESSNIISSLGFTTKENIENVLAEKSGVLIYDDSSISKTPLPLSRIDDIQLNKELVSIDSPEQFTRFEKLCILSIQKTLANSKIDITDKRTIFILSTTKGNIDLLDKTKENHFDKDRATLWKTAEVIADYFKASNKPIIISNACISGVNALILGKRLIDEGSYYNAIITGADVLSKFVVSGFQSFLSLSPTLCRPFDINRSGLNIGEGVATIVLSKNEDIITIQKIELVDGATHNDANHISGPSRTGEGLFLSINNTLKNHNIKIDCISAHGTATPYNDDMESKAIMRSGLENVPVNSLKGYFGHTLGAAGVIESIISIEALKQNSLIKTLGFSDFGVAEPITISDKTEKRELKTLLKLASGFGGCNAAALFVKHV